MKILALHLVIVGVLLLLQRPIALFTVLAAAQRPTHGSTLLVATAVPCAWLGGQLRVMQLGQSDGHLQQR
jgi:hypothetical protein